jgi:hypothetical protein
VEQDFRKLDADVLELVEKQTLRTVVQALQQYSPEAQNIFETTQATPKSEVVVLAEDLVQYALEVAEVYPINKRFAGYIDYKRARWLPTPYGLLPQILLVDAKASTENTRDTLQNSQLPMDAEFRDSDGKVVTLAAGVPAYMELDAQPSGKLYALPTSIFVHFYYRETPSDSNRERELISIFALCIPHGSLKPRYNPDPDTTFFGQGKHSPARNEVPRIRVYFTRLRQMAPWRLQELKFEPGSAYSQARWRDQDENGAEVNQEFLYLPR